MTKTNLVHLPTIVHVALFNEMLLPQIAQEGGRWFGVRTKDHHLPFADCEAILTPEGGSNGLQFNARKKNYNFNDSNWVGQAPITQALIECADKANPEKKHTKKDMYFFLEDIKNILKASPEIVEAVEATEVKVEETPAPEAPPAPEAASEAAPETPKKGRARKAKETEAA